MYPSNSDGFDYFQINFANKNSIPFLAVNGVHGSISTLGGMKSGIQIRLSKLNSIKIAKDGKTATIGGGVRTKDLTDTLWTAGKQAGKSETLAILSVVNKTDDLESDWNM